MAYTLVAAVFTVPRSAGQAMSFRDRRQASICPLRKRRTVRFGDARRAVPGDTLRTTRSQTSDPAPSKSRRNVSEAMSQYLSGVAILLMVLSPLFIPVAVTVVHRASGGRRTVTNRRRTAPATSLT